MSVLSSALAALTVSAGYYANLSDVWRLRRPPLCSLLTQEIKLRKLGKTKWAGSANGLNRQNISM